MIRTLELVLHGHGMHSSFPSQPYNAQYMLVTATACAVHVCHGHVMHNGHGVHQAGHRHTTSSLFRLMLSRMDTDGVNGTDGTGTDAGLISFIAEWIIYPNTLIP